MYSFKLTFECTNNVAEYEALLLGLIALKDVKAKRIDVFGDYELVVNQVNDNYQTKHPRMRAYKNKVWDMLGNFFTEYKVRVIPRRENQVANSLDTTSGNFKVPIYSTKKYKIAVVNRPSIPNNSKYLQVFEYDVKIKIFLELSGKFANTQIDIENQDS